MWCPFCSNENTRVVDSRLTRDGMQIRRRRQCEECGARFNTYEAPEIKAPRIIKTDGTREAFSEDKLRTGMLRALEKRPVETREVEQAIRTLQSPKIAESNLEALTEGAAMAAVAASLAVARSVKSPKTTGAKVAAKSP